MQEICGCCVEVVISKAFVGYKMESLGERSLLVVADCCMVVSASKVGCKSNCIYFTRRDTIDWWLLT